MRRTDVKLVQHSTVTMKQKRLQNSPRIRWSIQCDLIVSHHEIMVTHIEPFGHPTVSPLQDWLKYAVFVKKANTII